MIDTQIRALQKHTHELKRKKIRKQQRYSDLQIRIAKRLEDKKEREELKNRPLTTVMGPQEAPVTNETLRAFENKPTLEVIEEKEKGFLG